MGVFGLLRAEIVCQNSPAASQGTIGVFLEVQGSIIWPKTAIIVPCLCLLISWMPYEAHMCHPVAS